MEIKSLQEKSYEFLAYKGDNVTKLSTLLFIRSEINHITDMQQLEHLKLLLENLIDKLTDS
jgi:hypothetical protein